MPQINLLPWRDQLREQRKREFFVMLVGIVIIAGGLVFLGDRFFRTELDQQQARNQLITREIAVMDARVASIAQLRQQQEDIRDRIEVISGLQRSRPVIVHVFDELVRALPQGVYFNTLAREGDRLRIEGVAESNNRVSELMRRLDDSRWFSDPGLQRIATTTTAGFTDRSEANTFTLTLQISSADTMTGGDDE